PAREPVPIGDRQRLETLLDALVGVAKALLEPQHFLADDLESEVPGLDDSSVNRSDGDLVHAVAADPHEGVILLAGLPLGRRFEIAPQWQAVDVPTDIHR